MPVARRRSLCTMLGMHSPAPLITTADLERETAGRHLGRHGRLRLRLVRLGVCRHVGGPGPTRLAGDVPGFLALSYRLNPVTRFVSRHLRPRLGRLGDVCRVARHVCPRLRSVCRLRPPGARRLLSVTDTTALYVSAHPHDRVRRASGLVLTPHLETHAPSPLRA